MVCGSHNEDVFGCAELLHGTLVLFGQVGRVYYVGGKPRVESVINGNEGKGTKNHSLRPAGIKL